MAELLNVTDANSIELHYWFDDNTHTMDAVVQNKCEYQLLGIVKTIATAFEVDILIETEPLANGGLKRIFKVINKTEGKSATITTALIIALFTNIVITPVTTVLTKTVEKVFDNFFEDKELKSLEKELKKEQIENLKVDTKLKIQKLKDSTVVVKKRSEFYEAVEKYPKVSKVGLQVKRDDKDISDEHIINRSQFKEFILASDKLEPAVVDGIEIEIISPVLKKGNYKWRGIYNGEPISFSMKSNEYKQLVQDGAIEFKNGSSIRCLLEIEKAMDNEGNPINTGYNILRVNEYFVNDKPFETKEGKQHRQKQEADKQQLKLFPPLEKQ